MSKWLNYIFKILHIHVYILGKNIKNSLFKVLRLNTLFDFGTNTFKSILQLVNVVIFIFVKIYSTEMQYHDRTLRFCVL